LTFEKTMIRKTLPSDLNAIHILAQSCAKAMIAKEIYQWNEHYPTRSRFEKDIELQESYVIEEDHQIKGTIVVTELMDDEYIPEDIRNWEVFFFQNRANTLFIVMN